MGNDSRMKNVTQKKIAEWCGLKEPFLSKILNGKKRPSAERAEALEEITGISFRDWLRADHEELRKKVVISYQVLSGNKKDHNNKPAVKA